MKYKIETEKAPAAIGPYSQAVGIGNLIFVSGSLPVNPESSEIPEGIIGQTKLSLNNLKNVVESAGAEISDICKTTVFLSDMKNFAEMNSVYMDFFKNTIFPARSAVEVSRLPKDVLVEIEAIAWKN